MTAFHYHRGTLFVEGVDVHSIAEQYGTPCYVYSRAALIAAYDGYRAALADRDALICYAVKANANLAILSLFARLGSGFDIVSGGELARVLAAGGQPGTVVFSGVGKRVEEIRAALTAGIYCFNVESEAELARIEDIAHALNARAPIAIRVNPDIDAGTHPYISTGLKRNKFGIPLPQAEALYRRVHSSPHLEIKGIACHIGSQLLDPAPAAEAAARVADLADRLRATGIRLQHLDLGGGLGISYRDERAPSPAEFMRPILAAIAGRTEKLLIEPGRSLVGAAGVLLSRVEYLKFGTERDFAIVDAAMNDLMRPALYDAYHDIIPGRPRSDPVHEFDIVGPVCESGDFLGLARPLAVAAGDLLAVTSAGAYGMAMSSNYNSRPRAAEVMVDGSLTHLVRERETIAQLFANEHSLPY
ncbi:MAG: diaminopimelate decarboxylase [Rhodocyclaceae bacterium]|nr:diaminopimelate decarboxylase [Rhodocyclaceae bacterium]